MRLNKAVRKLTGLENPVHSKFVHERDSPIVRVCIRRRTFNLRAARARLLSTHENRKSAAFPPLISR